jgi:membrane-associated phospholipid phosphatase
LIRSTPLHTALFTRLRANLWLKLFLLLALPTVVTAAYLAVQRTIMFPPRSVPSIWLDHAIPFQPLWVWAYLSLYLLNPIGPLFTRSRQDLLHYAYGILFMFATGLVCCVLLPVAGPRPTTSAGYWLYDRLILVDRSYNSFPSLHAACAVYAVLYATYASRDSSRSELRKILLSLAWLWTGLILYSTIATRQHFAIDLLPGIFLAWLTQRLFFGRKAIKTEDVRSEQEMLIGGEAA